MKSSEKNNYGIVLDAGSSGTRLYIYRWFKNEVARQGPVSTLKSLPELETKKKWIKKIHPGISTFGTKPEVVGSDHLKELLDHAREHIPKDAWAETPIFLLATAGMRLLPDYERATLLKNICSYIRTETTFLIPDCNLHVQVISGETEGLYGWIATNYLVGGFDTPDQHNHGKGHHTYGFLDMGGASAQIAFAPNATEAAKHANDLKLVRLRTIDGTAQEHRVFVTTWLGFGVNEARKRYLKGLLEAFASEKVLDPCLPLGYATILDPHKILPSTDTSPERKLIGTGLFDECLRRTTPLLEKNMPCLDEPCLVNGQHVPAIDFDVNHFIGVSEYWHTTHEALQLADADDKVYDFKTYQSRVKSFCGRPWADIQTDIKNSKYKKLDEQTAYELCFKASWLINMLHDGIGIPRVGIEEAPSSHNGTKEVIESSKQKGYLNPFQAVDKIKSTEVSWTLGKMALYASATVPPSGIAQFDSYPVGFGSNVPGHPIPSDFEYPGGGRLQTTPSVDTDTITYPDPDPQSITDKLSSPFLKADSPHRLPGLILFLVIIIIALFYLCGRDRRMRFFNKYLPFSNSSAALSMGKKPHSQSHSRITSLINKYILRRPRSSAEYDRAMEEGSSTRLFDPADVELGDLNDSDSDSIVMPSSKSGKIISGSGYASPTTNRSRTPRPKLTSSQSAVFAHAGRLMPEAMDRRGLVVRTESRERVPLGGRKSRSGSLSPTRLRPVD